MKGDKNIQDELKDIAPWLSERKKQQSFKVPDNYFDQMQAQVMEQVKLTPLEAPVAKGGERSRLSGIIDKLFKPRMVIALPMLVIVVAIGLNVLLKETPTGPTELELLVEELDYEEIEDYLFGTTDHADMPILLEQLDAEDLASNDAGLYDELDPNDIEEYLLNNFDETLLTDEDLL